MGALAAADVAAEPKTDVVADLVAIAPTNLSAKPMADAPALARSDACTVGPTDPGALFEAVARALFTADVRPHKSTEPRANARAHAAANAAANASSITGAELGAVHSTYARAICQSGQPDGGSRIFADAAAFFTAEFEADKGADAGTVGPTHTAADAPTDAESLSGAVE